MGRQLSKISAVNTECGRRDTYIFELGRNE